MNTHRIHRVAKLTGLSKDVIRVWERRYGVIRPERTFNRYRIYTDDDVALLRYLKAEMQHGAAIGDLMASGRDALITRMRAATVAAVAEESALDRLLDELARALDPFDPALFERRLHGAVAILPFEEALHRLLLPLQRRVGELWRQQRLSIADEHYVTRLVQQKLFTAMNQFGGGDRGPRIVVACPAGEPHEVGAQAVAYLCRARGCAVHYLGADMPATALAQMVRQAGAELALLSQVMDADGAVVCQLAQELLPLGPVWVGGNGALAARAEFEARGFRVLADLGELERELPRLIARSATGGRTV